MYIKFIIITTTIIKEINDNWLEILLYSKLESLINCTIRQGSEKIIKKVNINSHHNLKGSRLE